MVERISRWMAKNAPSREDMARSRWTRPFARRTDLWRFTRRSVPRGVSIGLLVGIFLMVPGLQIIGAALLSLPFRANVPIAAAMTFLSNPATTPFFLVAALMVGNRLGFRADLDAFYALYERRAGFAEWTGWLFSDAAPALVSGLFVIAAASALVGYVVSVFAWRWWTAAKWKRRHGRSRA
jgi:uncharacterized protein (DUF2062 family)